MGETLIDRTPHGSYRSWIIHHTDHIPNGLYPSYLTPHGSYRSFQAFTCSKYCRAPSIPIFQVFPSSKYSPTVPLMDGTPHGLYAADCTPHGSYPLWIVGLIPGIPLFKYCRHGSIPMFQVPFCKYYRLASIPVFQVLPCSKYSRVPSVPVFQFSLVRSIPVLQ